MNYFNGIRKMNIEAKNVKGQTVTFLLLSSDSISGDNGVALF